MASSWLRRTSGLPSLAARAMLASSCARCFADAIVSIPRGAIYGVPEQRAIARERAEDPKVELRGIFEELFDLMYANRHRIKLLDRSMDHPELEGLWQSFGREQSRLAIERYLEKRIEAGQVRAVPNVRLAARFAIEALTTWAVHIHWDRAPEVYDPAQARANAIDFVMRGLIADDSQA